MGKVQAKEKSTAEKIGDGLIIGGIVVGGLFLLPMFLGFGVVGIGAGSAAAAIQSTIGNIAAGSWFATFQSLGATSALTTGALTGTGAAAIGGGVKLLTEEADEKNKTKNKPN